jgi:hypothetical protein
MHVNENNHTRDSEEMESLRFDRDQLQMMLRVALEELERTNPGAPCIPQVIATLKFCTQ